jgi:two-component system, NtrC family, sensor kinase
MNPYSIPPLLTLICFSVLMVIAATRKQKSLPIHLFTIICALGTLLYIDILLVMNIESARTALLISRIDHIFVIYLIPVFIHFFHAYLGIHNRRWLLKGSYIYAFILMWLTPTTLYFITIEKYFFGYFARGGILYPFPALILVTLYLLGIVVSAIRREKSAVRKNRLKYLLAGIGIMGLMNGLNMLPILGFQVYPPGNLSFIPLAVFGVGLFKHDVLDMGTLVKKGLLYSILTGLLTCTYALLIIIAEKISVDLTLTETIWFPALFFLLITSVFGPLRSRIQRFVDRLFYKDRYDYQRTLKNISRTIASILDLKKISRLVSKSLVQAMGLDHCRLFLSCGTDERYLDSATGKILTAENSPLVQFLKIEQRPLIWDVITGSNREDAIQQITPEIKELAAVAVFPMIFKEHLNGFIVLGEKRSGDLFTPEDIDLVDTLSSQSAMAIENANVYKRIDDLNKTLEKRILKRTSELEKALKEKGRTQEQLVRSESLAAIGQLVAGVAHELNNPLASVKSLLQSAIQELSQEDGTDPISKELLDDLAFAEQELGRAIAIVASLLGLSRQTQTYSEEVDLNTVLKDALRILHNRYKESTIEIIENYDHDIPRVHGNFAHLGQVALNTIQNAIQAVMDQNGSIVLSTHYDRKCQEVVFRCQDTGPGIPESIRGDIFKPFFTTKEVGRGTGLGLYICHEIIKKHKGSIHVRDSQPQGTILEIRLPLTQTDTHEPS